MADTGGVERVPSRPGLGRLGSPGERRQGRGDGAFRRQLDGDDAERHSGGEADAERESADRPQPDLQSDGSVIRKDPRDGSFHVDVVV